MRFIKKILKIHWGGGNSDFKNSWAFTCTCVFPLLYVGKNPRFHKI